MNKLKARRRPQSSRLADNKAMRLFPVFFKKSLSPKKIFWLGLLAGGLGFSAPSQGIVLVEPVFQPLKTASLFGKASPYPHPQKKVRRLAAKAEETEKKVRLHHEILTAAYSMDLRQAAAILNSWQKVFFLNGSFYKMEAPPAGAADGDQSLWISGPLPLEEGKKGISPEDLEKLLLNPGAGKLVSFIEGRGLDSRQTALILLLFLRDKRLTDSEALSLIEPVMLQFGMPPGELLRAKDLVPAFWPGFFEAAERAGLKPSDVIASFAHFAAISGRKELFVRLLSRGDFDPSLQDAAGRSPLHSLFLIKPNTNGWTSKDWDEVISAIQKNPKSDLNLKDIHGQTPIAIAAVNGHYYASKLLLEAPGADLQVRDSYGRTLAIIAAGSPDPRRKELASLMLRKGGSHLAAISGLNEYLTKGFEFVLLSALHPLEGAIYQAFSILSQSENADPKGFELLKERQDLLKKSLAARASIAAGLDSAARLLEAGGGGARYQNKLLMERAAIQKAIEENNLSFIEGRQKQLEAAGPDGRNILFEPLSSLTFRKNEARGSVFVSALKVWHFLLSAIEMNQPDMVLFFLERLGPEAGYVFRPRPENVPELPLEEAKAMFSEVFPEDGAFDSLDEKIPESVVFMDPLSEALAVSAELRSESRIENRELEQEKSRKILSALINHESSDLLFESFMGLTPMEAAILTGHLDVVLELRKKNVPLPADKHGLFGSGAPLKEVAREMGFKKMARHLDEAGPNPQPSGCRGSFLH